MKSKYIASIAITGIIIAASVFIAIIYQSDLDDVGEDQIPEGDDTPFDVGNLTFGDSVSSFAFDIYKQLVNANDGNIFISPYSIFTALAMTYEGARNDTAEQMASVLGVEQDNESFHQYMKSLYEYLNENSDYNISTANALWVRKNFHLLTEYINVIQTYYGGESSEVDFSNPQQAADIINEWVENQTNNLIKDLVPPSAIDPFLTMLILTNAIYFKGTWKIQFDEANTTDRDFEISEGETIEVPTMSMVGTEDLFNYTETDDLQILELPYTGNDISMVLLLPKEGVTLSDVISSIDNEKYSEWIGSMSERKVDIYLPKFKFLTEYKLNQYLIDLGMQDAFTYAADFSGINGETTLFIDSVLHKAFIEVNEEGTEAAAATAVIMNLKGPGPDGEETRVVFNADHPFLFVIQHKETNTILFIGNANNPIA